MLRTEETLLHLDPKTLEEQQARGADTTRVEPGLKKARANFK
jgi:hypothetical protein